MPRVAAERQFAQRRRFRKGDQAFEQARRAVGAERALRAVHELRRRFRRAASLLTPSPPNGEGLRRLAERLRKAGPRNHAEETLAGQPSLDFSTYSDELL